MTRKKAKGGRPPKLTPDVSRRICDALRNGNYRTVAARLGGVTYQTMSLWLLKGRHLPPSRLVAPAQTTEDSDGQPFVVVEEKRAGHPLRLFFEDVERAETTCEAAMAKVIVDGAMVDPKHAKWWLSHRHRDRWGDNLPQKVELSGPGGGPIAIEDARATLAEKLDALARGRKAKAKAEK